MYRFPLKTAAILVLISIILPQVFIFSENNGPLSIDRQIAKIYSAGRLQKQTDLNTELEGGAVIFLYRDSDDRIKIFTRVDRNMDSGVESRKRITAYYNNDGGLLMLLFSFKNNKGILHQYKFYYIGGKWFEKNGPVDPEIIKKECLPPYISIESLTAEFKSGLKKLVKAGTWNFRLPDTGDNCYITGMNVNVRKNPDTKSDLAGIVSAGDSVYIVNIGRKEKIGDLGENKWYEVAYIPAGSKKEVKGWIYGAFLEPVETSCQ